jgi:hypothetical protein
VSAQVKTVRLNEVKTLDRSIGVEWMGTTQPVVIGKDILELLSTSMYLDPMTIYREYIQNSADAIDDARKAGMLSPREFGEVKISLDLNERRIAIRDNGTGIPGDRFQATLTSLGASAKRGTAARGFRGVGRLAGLGYCQELVFRSRAIGEDFVSELRWDCRSLKAALRALGHQQDLTAIVRDVVSVRRLPATKFPSHFFEVELSGVVRHRDDRLLSEAAVANYLAQVAPVPFAPDFRFAADIEAALSAQGIASDLRIYLNSRDEPVYRPHRNAIETDGHTNRMSELVVRELNDVDGKIGAIGWTIHHDYSGALPTSALVRGLRFRVGNIQVGDNALLEDLFQETRFNSWAIGEIHILDRRVVPNGRRDHFEQGVHFDNLLNQLAPLAKDIGKRCRGSSLSRQWIRTFEAHRTAAIDYAKTAARGGLSKEKRRVHADAARRALRAMQKVVEQRHLAEDVRADLAGQARVTVSRVNKMIDGVDGGQRDPLRFYTPKVRKAYERIIGLIYECSANRAAAGAMVEKILDRLEGEPLNAKKPILVRRGRKAK